MTALPLCRLLAATPGRSMRAAGLVFGLAVAVCSAPRDANAAGNEFSLQGHDLIVNVDTRWAGATQGGYYPIRIRLVNRGQTRVLTLRFSSGERNAAVPDVQRTVRAEPNATIEFALLVPMVSEDGFGTLQVEHRGRPLEGLDRRIALPAADRNAAVRPSLLVIAPNNVDCSRFENAISALLGGSGRSGFSGRAGSARTSDHEVIPPIMLPENWIGYTGLDIVAVSLETLAGIPSAARSAILQWVECGGTLCVYEVGGNPSRSKRLADVLELGERRSLAADWHPADPDQRRRVSIPAGGTTGSTAAGGMASTGSSGAGATSRTSDPGFVWPESGDAFLRRQVMLGHVYAFAHNPFPGSAHDWAWFLRSLGADRYQWTRREGVTARFGNDHFLEFLIPGIRGVPVISFLVLITLFTIVIGPLNYLVLWKKGRLNLLVVTIPAVALVTSVSLLGYSTVAHGFGIKSRIRSLTVLDQGNNTAITRSRIALFAGLAPSEGLRFSPETAVFPIRPQGQKFETGHVDWTETQVLRDGWLRSRTRTQFKTVAHRTERGRLQVERPASGRLPVANGLEWGIEALLVADADGELYFGTSLPAGASTRLRPAASADRERLVELLDRHPLELPEGVSGETDFDVFGIGPRRRYYPGRSSRTILYSHCLTEQRLRGLKQRLGAESSAKDAPLTRKSYLAILNANPAAEVGLDGTDERGGYHVLIGHY